MKIRPPNLKEKGEIAESLPKKQMLTSDHFISLPTFTKYIRLIQDGNDLIFKVLMRRWKSKPGKELVEAESQCLEGMSERKWVWVATCYQALTLAMKPASTRLGGGGDSEREDRIEKCLGYCIKRILWSFQFESNFQLPGQRNQVMGDGALSFN